MSQSDLYMDIVIDIGVDKWRIMDSGVRVNQGVYYNVRCSWGVCFIPLYIPCVTVVASSWQHFSFLLYTQQI